MLYLFFGSDYQKARAQFHAAIAQAREKQPHAKVLTVDPTTTPPDDSLDSLTHPQLFADPRIILIDEMEEVPGWELTPERASACAAADDIVFAIAGTFSKKSIKEAEKAGGKVFECKKSAQGAAKAKKDSSSKSRFALTDAFAQKDKKRAWLLYRTLIDEGAAPEELHGLLAWQIKALVLSAKASSAKEAGLKPFVYQKAKEFLRRWDKKELADTYKEFVTLYHESRRGNRELETAIEKFLLR